MLDYLTGWRRKAWLAFLGGLLFLLAWALVIDVAFLAWLMAVWVTHG